MSDSARMLRAISRSSPALVCLAALTLYLHTTCPTLGGAFDSEEFQHVAYTLGIAHATGYPLYLLLGKLFTTLVPLGNVAYRMNLLSALITAGAVALVYLNTFQLTRRHLASLATAALFAINPAVWRQAGVASIGPLHLLLLNAMLYAMLRWYATQTVPKSAPALAAFLFGLGLAHHRTTLLFAPALALGVWLEDARILRRPRDLARVIAAGALPLLLYLYLPIFGGNSPWYSNTLEGFLAQISGGEAGDFMRTTPAAFLQGLALVAQYLHESFGYLGGILILVGVLSAFTRRNSHTENRKLLFLGIATLIYSLWGTLYAGEPDRYLVLPFAFLIYWFALGASECEDRMQDAGSRTKKSLSAPIVFAIILALFLALPFADRWRAADWSAFDRVYKTWDEIFTLPIPPHATLVGHWGQLNAMRYMQRVEQRRPDLQFVGTLYDPAPQTDAARAAFANGRALFLAPGIALPLGAYRYAQLGPLVEVRDAPQMQPPTAAQNLAVSPSLTLADFSITTALEPYAPTTQIAPTRTARVALTWRAEARVADFLVRVRLYDPDARVIAQKDEPPVRGLYSTARWQRGEYVGDVHNLQIPAGTPPGQYTIHAQTLDAETKKPIGGEIALASFAVARVTNLARDQIFVQRALDLALEPQLALWGCGGCEGTRRAGEMLSISLVFGVRADIHQDLTLQFALVDAASHPAQEWTRTPIAFYPTREWQRGEILKAYYDLPLSDDLPAGEWTLAVGLSQAGMTGIGKIHVTP